MTFIDSIARYAGLSSDKRLTLQDLLALRRQRNQLSQLDSAALRDMGLSDSDVAHEVRRSFWDAPSNWHN